MNETNYEALRSAFDTILTHIKALDTRLSNTMENVKPIIENLNERMDRIDKGDEFSLGTKEAIQDIVISCMQESCVIDDKITSALEEYEPTEHMDFADEFYNEVIGSSTFENAVRDAVKELSFTVEVN